MGDVDLVNKNKMCTSCGEKLPSFGPTGGKKPERCAGCKIDGDVNLRNVKLMCSVCGLTRSSYGPPGGKVERCAGCKLGGDVTRTRKCETCGIRTPKFGPMGTHFPRCGTCKIDGDIDHVQGCQRCFRKKGVFRLPNHPAPRRCRPCMEIEQAWARAKKEKEDGDVKKKGEEKK